MELTFAHQRVLVLGGSSEIGLAVAQSLLASELCPILTYASDSGRQRIADKFPELADVMRVDLNDATTLDSPQLLGADALIDLAQADFESLLASVDDTTFDAYCAAHIQNRAKLLKKITRQMLARRSGRLIFVSSVAAGRPAPGQGLYAATKNAAESLYHCYGVELAAHGITSVSLRLGLVDSGRGKTFLNTSARTELRANTLGVQQAAGTILFLLSREQAFHATTLTMDAGLSAIKY